MTKVWVFDTETTDTDEDRQIVEAAWFAIESDDDEIKPMPSPNPTVVRYQPTKPISCGSAAVHHILPSDLAGFGPSSNFKIPPDVDYVIGHNVDFDWEAAGRPAHVKRIDTDPMSRWIWQDADSYSQSALLYKLYGQTHAVRAWLKDVHSAGIDVENNVRLLVMILGQRPEITAWSQLHAYSEECRIPRCCPFRQYRGMPFDELVDEDRGYVEWIYRQDWIDSYLRTAVARVLGYEEIP